MILLVSGGLDSIAVWRLLGCPDAIHFELNTRAVNRERYALDWAEAEARSWWGHPGARIERSVLPLGRFEQDNGYLPYRNALLVMHAALRDPDVAICALNEWAPDKNPRFWRQLERLLNTMGRSVVNDIDRQARVSAPFARHTKGALLREYRDTFGHRDTVDLLQGTWSCYSGRRRHCGTCSGCVQRYVAETAAYVRVTEFAQLPDPKSFYTARWNVSDGLRWLRGSGHRSLFDLTRRALEARRAFATPDETTEVD